MTASELHVLALFLMEMEGEAPGALHQAVAAFAHLVTTKSAISMPAALAAAAVLKSCCLGNIPSSAHSTQLLCFS